MKTLKKLAGVCAFAVLLFGTSTNVYAATNDDIINSLKSAKVDAVYITKAENYLKSANLTAAQLDTINANVQEVSNLLKAENVTDVTKLSKADKDKVMDAITDAAKAADLTVSFGKDSSGFATITLKDATGDVVFKATGNEKGLKVTGAEVNPALYGGILLVLAAAGLFVARKKAAVN